MSRDDDVRLSIEGRIVVQRLRPAKRMHERFLGLMGRAPSGPGTGLWLSPCMSIHTCFMRFAIDVAFLDRAGIILRVARNIRPWRLVWAPRGTHSVVEVESGWMPESALKPGDRTQIG